MCKEKVFFFLFFLFTLRDELEKTIKNLPDSATDLQKIAYDLLVRIYHSLQYAAIAWCTHDHYDIGMYEIELQNLEICVKQMTTLLEKNCPPTDLRHLITVTNKQLDNFLQADFSVQKKEKGLTDLVKIRSKKRDKKNESKTF